MRRTRLIAALLLATLLPALCACGKTATQTPDEPTGETLTEALTGTLPTEAVPTDAAQTPTEDAALSETGADESATEEESTEPAAITLEAGLNSTDIEEVLTFYKLAAAKNDVKQYTKTLDLVSLNGGETKVASYVSVFEPIAKKAVAKNTVTGDTMPGKYDQIRPSDWASASAVSDGTYTTIRVQVVPQTDGPNGKALEGPVGRSMTVLDGVDQAVNEMPGVSADFSTGKMRIEYQNPTITVKVDNRTGKFVQGACKWTYRVNTVIESLDAKVLAFNFHLQNASGVVDYTMSY